MELTDVIDSFRADVIVSEASKATALGVASGALMTGGAGVLSVLGAEAWGTLWLFGTMGGFVVAVGIYVLHFGAFSAKKVTDRLTRRGVVPAPEVSFARLDALLRRLWMFGWMFGVLEGLALSVAAS